MNFFKIFDKNVNIEKSRKTFSFIGLSTFWTGQALATFQPSGDISLSIDELIIFTIGK